MSHNDTNSSITLHSAVQALGEIACSLTDSDLEYPWAWQAYDEGVRHAFVRTCEQLRQLAAEIESERVALHKPATTAQRLLGYYHIAFRQLQGVLLGINPGIFDQPPAQDEWSLRLILAHIMAGEREYFARIRAAVDAYRREEAEIHALTEEEVDTISGSYATFENTVNRLSLNGTLAYYERWHRRVLQELADIRGYEIEAPSLWWEGEPMPVIFRLTRFESHLRQHILQVEKTLTALGIPSSEGQRWNWEMYTALGTVESAVIGAWRVKRDALTQLATEVAARAQEISALLD